MIQVVWVYILIINSNNNNVVVIQSIMLTKLLSDKLCKVCFRFEWVWPSITTCFCWQLYIVYSAWCLGNFFELCRMLVHFFSRWLFWGIVFSWLVCQWLQNGVTSYDFFIYIFCVKESGRVCLKKHAFYVQK